MLTFDVHIYSCITVSKCTDKCVPVHLFATIIPITTVYKNSRDGHTDKILLHLTLHILHGSFIYIFPVNIILSFKCFIYYICNTLHILLHILILFTANNIMII